MRCSGVGGKYRRGPVKPDGRLSLSFRLSGRMAGVSRMAVVSVQQALGGGIAAGSEVTVRGWVRTRRDSKAGLSFVSVSDGSGFNPIQVVAEAALPNYESEVKHLT